MVQDQHKSYAANRRRDLEFQVGDQVFMRISPWKGVLRIVERMGKVAYRLRLPPELARIHDVFHGSMLRKYIADPSPVLRDQPVELKEDITYEERPVQIVNRKDQVLRNKAIPLVKVLWMNYDREEANGNVKIICKLSIHTCFSQV